MSQPIRFRSAAASSHVDANEASSSIVTKNVLVLGGSYGGMHAATVLAQRLPPSHRVILIERNSHFNHLYVFPRFSVLPGHEHKAFIPYSSIFKDAPVRSKAQKGPRKNASKQPQKYAMAAASRTTNQTSALEMGGCGDSSSSKAGPSRMAAVSPAVSDVPEGIVVAPHFKDERSQSPVLTRGRLHERGLQSRGATRSRDSRHSSKTTLSSSAESETSTDAGTSTMASSYTSNGTHTESSLRDVGNKAVEVEIANASTNARQEEKLGRPEIQVAELCDAVQQGIDLGEEEEGDVTAERFEESAPHVVLQATVTDISPVHVTVTPADASSTDLLGSIGSKKSLWSIDSVQIPYSHLIYALGSHLPDPLRTEARTKQDGVSWMREIQDRIKGSDEIILVGGGALGVEFATDIASVYGNKKVTLIHSRQQLLPNFDKRIHEVAYKRLKELGVNVVLGERLALTEGCPRGSTVQASKPEICKVGDDKGEGVQAHAEGMCVGSGRKLIKTTGGRSFECDLLLLCTGQQPNSSLMAHLSPSSVVPSTRLIRVQPTLQVAVPDPRDAAQMPFDARPPCGDCDCFLDKKAAGAEMTRDEQGHLIMHGIDPEHEPGRLSNVYAIGDCADAFGALNAGYQAWAMAETAAENILRDVEAKNSQAQLIAFQPAVNMLKLSLGLGSMVLQSAPVTKENLSSLPQQGECHIDSRIVGLAEISIKHDPEDLGVEGVWTFMANADTSDMHM